jgi:hypothetical protein
VSEHTCLRYLGQRWRRHAADTRRQATQMSRRSSYNNKNNKIVICGNFGANLESLGANSYSFEVSI